MERALEISVGSLSPTINWKTLAQEEFALPPLNEQRRVSRLLQAHELLRGRLHDLLAATRRLLPAYIEQSLEEKHAWSAVPVGELLAEPPRNGLSPTTNIKGRGMRTVSISAVANGIFDPDGHVKYVDVNVDDIMQIMPFLVRSGDIFAVRALTHR